ncbi:multidrug resistance protein MdtC [bacterium BMS3Abin09]|nr:multidrug resistance protein MdtC [bacterium BMS3Abin09]GBE40598.1 multidrug resistance protein MdtC [bacterium BMS3Bbin09]
MDVVEFAIKKPVTVIVGIILILLFGLIGLFEMPYQLSPDVTVPEIEVRTVWPGATPYEVERDIIEEQEQVLKGIPRLTEMESTSTNSQGSVTLRFSIGTDINNAVLRVSNKLNEVSSYPENVERPVINATGAATSPVIWIIMKADDDNPNDISTYKTFFENEVRQHLERVKGVADLFIGGGRESEMHVIADPAKLASFGLTVNDLINVLKSENVDVSAGTMGVGRRNYRIRTVGQFRTPEEMEKLIIRSDGQRRITLADVAKVEFGYEKKSVAMIHNMKDGIAIGVKPEPGTNILDMTDRVEETLNQLNAEIMAPQKISLNMVYNQRPYIQGAINLVKRNILIGGILAIIVLLIFLRSLSSTIVVAVAIPISVIGTFFVMNALGRNLNVVSLAGIAFAVGMLVDNAIVVLENIDRHRGMGKNPYDAAYDGTHEVWGAVLASTLTTVAVFLPVVFVQEEAGQLFRDIAIAVSCAVTLSLFVSVLVIPMLSEKLFSTIGRKKAEQKDTALTSIGNRLVEMIMRLVNFATASAKARIITIVLLTSLSILSGWLLMPKSEYLPQGNRNLVISILIPPPGLSYKEKKEIGDQLFGGLKDYIGKDHEGLPAIENMFYVGSDRFDIVGAISADLQRAGELLPLFMKNVNSIPGMFGISMQAGIFQNRLGRGRTVEVNVVGDDMNRIVAAAGAMFGIMMKEIPGAQIRPVPSLELLYPEVRLLPDRERLRASGMSAAELGIALDVMMDGRKIGEFMQEGKKKINLVMMAPESDIDTPEKLYNAMIATPAGKVMPVSSFTTLKRTTGIDAIRHLERKRTITLQVTPPANVPIEKAMDVIDGKVIPAVRSMGLMGNGTTVSMSGVADKLKETQQVLQWNFVLAALIAYLLMSALFGNFVYPLIIMFTVPLAGAGGFMGLALVNQYSLMTPPHMPTPFDILTMLGFIILIGVVVNNAILIVHQSLNNVRHHGMDYNEAVIEATRTRLRPIYMSATTSIFGMLPLVVAPGPGSELYRGLGSVILGGLALSTVFTVFMIPALMMFVIRMEKRQ